MMIKKIWVLKKGIFFTFAAIALSIIILLSFSVYKTYEMKEKADVIGVRVNTMNDFIKDVEQDLENGLYIASFRAFASMSQHIADNGEFIEDLEDAFDELVLQGTLDGEELSLMEDSTFTDWVDKIEIEADKIDILVSFTINEVSISQTDPWSISANANIDLAVEDKKGTSSWEREKDIITKINITNFEDPVYLVNSIGRVTNPIVKSPITDFVTGEDVSNLLTHLDNSYYIESTTAPNYLMRLQGDLSNSLTGIESLVDLEEFQAQGLAIKDRSAVDYIYFGTQTTTNYGIDGMPDWFKMDNNHLEVYEVQDLTR